MDYRSRSTILHPQALLVFDENNNYYIYLISTCALISTNISRYSYNYVLMQSGVICQIGIQYLFIVT